MRRGRIFIFLALIIIIGVAGAYFYFTRIAGGGIAAGSATATPATRFVEVLSAAQKIAPGTLITQEMISSYQMPEENLVEGLFIDPNDVINMYAKIEIPQGAPITSSAISAVPGNVSLAGSPWANSIPQGLTAISIPISRLSTASFGIRDGDYVDVIITMLLVDVDPGDQSILPNDVAMLDIKNGVYQITQQDMLEGVFEIDPVVNSEVYIGPSEPQRPRMVTQMILQRIQVLHVGTFALVDEVTTGPSSTDAAAATPTPQPGTQQQVVTAPERPDLITLMVTPQDAVTLTYLIYSGININLTLRNPNDLEAGLQPDAAMLEYLLTQYNIPVPAKLPYSLEPRVDDIVAPELPNDAPTPIP